MDKKTYRIVEKNGLFYIQIWDYEQNYFFWWIKKWGWFDVNYWGTKYRSYPIPQPRLRPFGSLKKAKKQVLKFQNSPKYYNV